LFCPYTSAGVFLGAAVDLTGIRQIEIRSAIRVDPAIAGIPVLLGGFATGPVCNFQFAAVTDGSSLFTTPPARPIVRVIGLKSSFVSIENCNYLQVYADTSLGANFDSTAYNTFQLLGVCNKLEISGAAGFSWVTENRFFGGRIRYYDVIPGGYEHNHNKLYDPTFEGSQLEIEIGGSLNQVFGARFENVTAAPGIVFPAGSYSNTIEYTWSGVGNSRGQFSRLVDVSDSGEGNAVYHRAQADFRRQTLFSVSPQSMIVATATDSAAPDPRVSVPIMDRTNKAVLTPGLKTIGVGSFRMIGLSDMIPVSLGSVVSFSGDFDGALMRTRIFVFDEDQKPITSEGGSGVYISMPGVSAIAGAVWGVYQQTVNQTASAMNTTITAAVVRSEVKFIRVAVEAGSAGVLRSVAAYIWSRPADDYSQAIAGLPVSSLPVINGTPTRGFVPTGFAVYETAGPSIKRVSYSWETQVDGALSEGATSVTVIAAGSIANGDIVGVLLDNDETHWTAVSSISGATFTIDAVPAGRSVADGARIVFNRWA
jgi:hypothetical protein